MIREERLATLSPESPVDLLVVGGGATGLGVALDAVLRGFSVVLAESHDFAGGTSSRSTKLLHGGVRYLAQGNLSLVREALAERATLLSIAPHLAQPLPFVMPSYGWWQTPFYGLGLKLYDLLAGKAGLGRTEFLSRAEVIQALPGVQQRGLRGGVQYWDGQFDDARLALALARTAEAAGGRLFNYLEVTALQAEGNLTRATLKDRLGEGERVVRARCVVNATGVWVDALRNAAGTPSRMVSPSQGVHVVVDRDFLQGDHALLVPRTRDGRVLFAVPWLGKLILGTTDTPRVDLPREPDAFAEELEFILSEAGQALSRPVRRRDIRSLWVGLRPLVAPPAAADGETRTLSREHTIVIDGRMVTVTGGKWTTYRAMAEDVMERCFSAGLLPARAAGHTDRHALLGASGTGARATPLHAAPGLHLFGSESDEVSACGTDAVLGMGLTDAMVRHAFRCEYARTVEDLLARRWRALFLDATEAARMAPAVSAILAEEATRCGLSPRPSTDLDAFQALCLRYLPVA
ncbi:glycerol-3-phosphate dehydrogenase/oxidase [uncultured Hydrogenophaga sp.]|uniref:glycerol-3-phosphate dehydrogenase/oxidase n=1 Tax=uncultured Hydrogenophaga sp. TaxID=199683 RepID=UPI00265EA28A|nr:glycerol-3-phosphate dehydrogenase/oxidase [uncultured Hydrogenophaga sp.]